MFKHDSFCKRNSLSFSSDGNECMSEGPFAGFVTVTSRFHFRVDDVKNDKNICFFFHVNDYETGI